jgi:hypothetical protein
VRASRADHLEPTRGEPHPRLASHPRLRAGNQRLDVPKGGIEILALMQPIAVEPAELILPEGLPLGEHQLLELAVRADQEQRRARLEPDPALDAERGLAHVNAAADAVGFAELSQSADQWRAFERDSVERHRQSVVPREHDLT